MHFPSSNPEEGAEFEDFADIHSAPIDPAPSPIQYNEDKLKELFTELVAELRQRAVWSMQGANPGHTLQPTALIGEAYVRLSRSDELRWESKAHFAVRMNGMIKTMSQLCNYFCMQVKNLLRAGF